jgi:hypothetical protein
MTNPTDIQKWLDLNNIKNYTIDPNTGIVDTAGDVDIQHLDEGKIPIKFGTCKGKFIAEQISLTSLHGCPISVRRGFVCTHTQITSLEGGPHTVYGSYIISNNRNLTSLNGMARNVRRSNGISLSGSPVPVTELTHLSQGDYDVLSLSNITCRDLHNIQKYITGPLSKITVRYSPKSSHNWLGLFLINGIKTILIPGAPDVEKLFNDILSLKQENDPTIMLEAQERLSDAGYSKLARL